MASRRRKERVAQIWEDRSRTLPPLTCMLPAMLCSHTDAQEFVLVLAPLGQTAADR